MATEVTILADSLNPYNGKRLTTFKLKYPRIIHSEFMTHRMIARNAKSSRAMSSNRMITEVLTDPFVPSKWPAKSKTMHNKEWLNKADSETCINGWKNAMVRSVNIAFELDQIGCHKQIVNRLLEPWSYIEVVASATEWDNFFELRCSEYAQPEMRELADMMHNAYTDYGIQPVENEIHDPSGYCGGTLGTRYINSTFYKPNYYITKDNVIAASGLIAMVSYARWDKKDYEKDLELGNRLLESKHMSPFEHVAVPITEDLLVRLGKTDPYEFLLERWPHDSCINGWITARWMIEHEALLFEKVKA